MSGTGPRPWGVGAWGTGAWSDWPDSAELGAALSITFGASGKPSTIYTVRAGLGITLGVSAKASRLLSQVAARAGIEFLLTAEPSVVKTVGSFSQITFGLFPEPVESWDAVGPCKGGAWALQECSGGTWDLVGACTTGTWDKVKP